jgi:hypothetical protein
MDRVLGGLLIEYFWVLALGTTIHNYYHGKRSRKHPTSEIEAQETERYLLRGFVLLALPWVFMGIGQLTGSTPTVLHYFRPQDGNPFVIAWVALVFAVAYLFAGWVLLAGGAEKVRDLNLLSVAGFSGHNPPTLQVVKAVAAISIIIPPVWLLLALLAD